MRFFVKSKNKYLKQKIILEGNALGAKYSESEGCDIVFCDIDTALAKKGDITLSKSKAADIALPFEIGALDGYFKKNDKEAPILYFDRENEKITFRGEAIHLTGFEKRLFLALYNAGGKFVSREELLKTVWENEADIGIVNVYVYYVRKKLEKSGERVIIAARKEGYKIDDKFLGGQASC